MPKCYVQERAEDLGLPMIDGKTPVRLVVTASDVIDAKKANSKHCAFARAALRLPGVAAAYFFRTTAYLEYHDRMVRFLLPSSAQKEIVSFDRAQIMATGAYQLTPPGATRDRSVVRAYNKERNAKKSAPPIEAERQDEALTGRRDRTRGCAGSGQRHAGAARVRASRLGHRWTARRDATESQESPTSHAVRADAS